VYVTCRFGNSSGLQTQVVAETLLKKYWSSTTVYTFGAGVIMAQVALINDYKINMKVFQVSGIEYNTTSQITVYYR